LFVEYLDRTIRTRDEAEGLLGYPVLGTVPSLSPNGEAVEGGAPRVVVRDPFERSGEAFRGLRLNLSFLSVGERPVKSILVTSPGPVEGKSTTSLNLAATFAQYGERVLLVDADLRRPVLHTALELERDPGLTHLLIGTNSLDDVIHRDVIPNLDVIPAGPIPPNPAELVGSMTMSETLGQLESSYDRVIVDSPPALAVTDAAGTASFVDGVLLVLRSGRTEQRAAERTAEHLGRLGIRILGVVLNDIQKRVHEESYYLQYQAHYQADDPAREGPHRPPGDRLRGALAKVRLR
ncbi:MAG: polysaccharide biosynthesis tyrosine autokinase, partial [Gemmatimonadota bacterium]|nr:polysaccharide biosynthesis tyrosine autokinase [Gemmatimonadota bacterium]